MKSAGNMVHEAQVGIALWQRSCAYALGQFIVFGAMAALLPYVPRWADAGKDDSLGWALLFCLILSLLNALGFRIGLIAFSADETSKWEKHRYWLAFGFGAVLVLSMFLLRPLLVRINVGLLPGIVETFVGSILAALIYRRLVGARKGHAL